MSTNFGELLLLDSAPHNTDVFKIFLYPTRAYEKIFKKDLASFVCQERALALVFAVLHTVADARQFDHSAFAERYAELPAFAVKNSPWLRRYAAPAHFRARLIPLWYGEPNAVSSAIGYAKFYSRSHEAVIQVYDNAGNLIE